MRQRIDQTRVDGQIGIKKMGELDPVGLGHQSKQRTIAVERPRPPVDLDFEPVLVVAIEHGFGNGTVQIAVDDVDRLIADPVDRQDLGRLG